MYKLNIGRKGLLKAAEDEKGVDIGAGIFNAVLKAFSGDDERAIKMTPKDHINRMMGLVINCKKKSVEELTEEEKFALCFFHGCEIDFHSYNEVFQAYIPRTKYPCAITKDKDGFHVIEGR
jgi:hypothetical protein